MQTSFIAPGDLKDAAKELKRRVARPAAIAARFVDHAGSGEDPARVASALTAEMAKPAGGPAEEAATWVRVFLQHVPDALEWKMGIAWELRTRASCECAAREGTRPHSARFPPDGLRALSSSKGAHEQGTAATIGRLRCRECRATFTYTSTSNYTSVSRETKASREKPAPAVQKAASAKRRTRNSK